MKVLATVEDGKLIPKLPLRFSQKTLEIEIPDEAMEQVNCAFELSACRPDAEDVQSAEGNADLDNIFAKIRENLGPDYVYVDDGRSDPERFAEALEQLRHEK
jgi:hypothetical protein